MENPRSLWHSKCHEKDQSLRVKKIMMTYTLILIILVSQGHTDRDKFSFVHDSTTLNKSPIRLIISIAAMYVFKVWEHDITQAYIQVDSRLKRDV